MPIIDAMERRYPGHGEEIAESRRKLQEAHRSGDEQKTSEERQRHHELMRTIHRNSREERIKQKLARRGGSVTVNVVR